MIQNCPVNVAAEFVSFLLRRGFSSPEYLGSTAEVVSKPPGLWTCADAPPGPRDVKVPGQKAQCDDGWVIFFSFLFLSLCVRLCVYVCALPI